MAFRYDDDDDDDDLEIDLSALDEDEDEDEDEDDEEVVQRIEAAYRSERARIRACLDIHELREMREEHDAALADRGLHTAAKLRTRDLIELIDDRITDFQARRMAERRA